MKITNLQESGLSGGIMLWTEQDPTQEELNIAAKDFHLYPVIRETAIVVLLDPEKTNQRDREYLRALGIPGFVESAP